MVADSSKEDGHSRELRAGDPILVCYREGENYKEDGEDKIEVRFKVVPAKVCLCLLHIKARFKPCQQRCQGTKVLPGLEKGGKFTSERKQSTPKKFKCRVFRLKFNIKQIKEKKKQQQQKTYSHLSHLALADFFVQKFHPQSLHSCYKYFLIYRHSKWIEVG